MKLQNIKNIKKTKVGNEVSFKVRKSKTKADHFDVNFYNKVDGKLIPELKIQSISKQERDFVETYVTTYPKREKSFREYLKEIGSVEHDHFIDYLIESAYENEAKFELFIPKWEEEIKDLYKQVVEESHRQWAEISSDVFALERITDDVYGTTTMEWEIVDKEYVEKIIQYKNTVWESLEELEATNIRNGFIWAYKKSLEGDFVYSTDLVKQAHKITTKWLDSLVKKWLSYNLWKFRDYGVDMWIFQKASGKSEYYPPVNPEKSIEKLQEYMNTWDFNIVKLAHMHLFLYSIHPFSNGNKRSTRIIESLAIQCYFDKWHYFKGMGYHFKKHMPSYLKKVKWVLSGNITLREWVIYYVSSFQTMARHSLQDLKYSRAELYDILSKSRMRYYDETDKIFSRFYMKNRDEFFTAKDLNKYIAWYDKIYSDNKQIYKRIQKHLKDHLIYKTDQKEGRDTLYRVSLERKSSEI